MVKETAAILFLGGFLLWTSTGCGRQTGSGLSDRAFADLAAEVIRLNRRYAGQPDSLAARRTALFLAYGVTRQALERWIADREANPGAWAPALAHLKERLDGEDAELSGKDALGKYRRGGKDSLRGQNSAGVAQETRNLRSGRGVQRPPVGRRGR